MKHNTARRSESFRNWTQSVTVMWYLVLLGFSLVVVNCEYKYETKSFTVPLDHFNYGNNKTFQMKYLVNEDYWDKGRGPIFFYTGNEGQIEVFAQHTGFMWDIAQEYKAKLVFAEHRYYGKSMPFGDKSFEVENLGYLTSSQALADYAELINFLQDDSMAPRYPVIAFGGSYGGMLAAYFRIKYPHLVAGAIAASAPIHMFPGMTPCEIFNRIVTSSFTQANRRCSENVRNSWSVIRTFAANKSANASDFFKKNWNLCSPVSNSSDVDSLVDFLTSMYTTLAMVNYPFASDFLLPLPANPVRTVCQYLNEPLKDKKLLEAIGKVVQTFGNYNHTNKCIDYRMGDNYGNLDATGWDYQACTEMVMPICATGKPMQDMFEPSPWNLTSYSGECYKKYKVYPRVNDARLNYGGNLLKAASNIVFTNGLLDPWTAGGILENVSDTVKAVLIPDAAHHLDLMPASDADPTPVRMARSIHKDNINRWISDFYARNKPRKIY